MEPAFLAVGTFVAVLILVGFGYLYFLRFTDDRSQGELVWNNKKR